MKHKLMKARLLSLLTLLAILLPMIAISVAASDFVYFTFAFNGNMETWTKKGYKDDVAASSGYLGAVTVSSGDFGQGSVKFFISSIASDDDDYRLTSIAYANANGTYNMFYTGDALASLTEPINPVYLIGSPTTYYVWGCSGRFQP